MTACRDTHARALRRAATLAGLSYEDHAARLAEGLKRCTRCKAWKPAEDFTADASRWDGRKARCRPCAARPGRPTIYPRVNPDTGRSGPARIAARDEDRRQARRSVNREVDAGRLPRPNSLACTDCGHLGPGRRHEYDHHQGYAPEHHLTVEPVCTRCHARRTFGR